MVVPRPGRRQPSYRFQIRGRPVILNADALGRAARLRRHRLCFAKPSSSLMRYPTVLFDLDGTLVDSGAIILSSFKHAARTVLERDVEEEQIAALVGGSNLHDQMRVLDPSRVDDLVRVYREHNRPLHDELEAFDGVEELIALLAAQGRKLGIVTAKGRATVELAFAVIPLERYFGAVVTADMTERHKPDPEPVLKALELLDSEPAETVFV